MRGAVVALDLDGVLLNFEKSWRQCAEWVLRRTLPDPYEDYDLADRYGLSRREVEKVWGAFHRDNWWERIPMYEESWDVIEELEAMGCSLWAVTNVDARHLDARSVSLQGAIPYGRIITLGAEATPEDRVGVLRDLRAVAFVDDQSKNVNAAQPHVACTVLLDRGYRCMPEPALGITVIDDLRDFPETIFGIVS